MRKPGHPVQTDRDPAVVPTLTTTAVSDLVEVGCDLLVHLGDAGMPARLGGGDYLQGLLPVAGDGSSWMGSASRFIFRL